MRQTFFLHKWLIEQAARSTKPLSWNQQPPTPANLDNHDQGFALPLAVGMGLIMILVGMTMIARSQNDQITASAQKATASGLGVSEAGVTHVQSFLNKYRGFSTKSYPWSAHLTESGYMTSNCVSSSTVKAETEALNDWITLPGGTNRFKVVSYTPPTAAEGNGTLVLQGQARQETTVKSTSQLVVNIPVRRDLNPAFRTPGLWAERFNLGGNKVYSDVVIDPSCTITEAQKTSNIFAATSGTTPQIIQDPSMTLPPPLPVPSNAITLSAITNSLRLPRSSDVPNAKSDPSQPNDTYVYRVQASSGDSINLSGQQALQITPGKKVTLYLDGNVRTQGSGVKLGHNCYDFGPEGSLTTPNPPTSYSSDSPNSDGIPDSNTEIVAGCKPFNFQIYGGVNTTSIVFGGGNVVDAFIFAPNANAGVNGGAQIRGSIWVDAWDQSNSNQDVVIQRAEWSNFPLDLKKFLLPPRIDAVQAWQRQQATSLP